MIARKPNGTELKDFYDFVVIGGGPAGASFATIAAEHGRSVLVLEYAKFPRFVVGEIIAPTAIWRNWARLGLTREMLDDMFIQKWGGQFVASSGARFNFEQDVFPDEEACQAFVYTLDRAVYDEFLLNWAREKGATALEEARVDDVLYDENGRMNGVRFTRHGETHEVNCHLVVDASGRANYLGRKLGLRQEMSRLKSFATFAHWEGAKRESGIDEGNFYIYFDENRWIWWAPLKGNRVSVGLVSSRDEHWDEYVELGADKFYEKYVLMRPEVADALENAKRVTSLKPAPRKNAEGPEYEGYHYYATEQVGDGWVLLGDASGFVDPIFSAGLNIVQSCGIKLADLCHEGLEKGDLSKEYLMQYEKWYVEEFKGILSHIHTFAELYFNRKFIDLFLKLGNTKERFRRLYIDVFIAWDKDAIVEYGEMLRTRFRYNEKTWGEQLEEIAAESAAAAAKG
ncbi:MAG: NAD(P)/FAD-dependent oxidoreductase [Phycisphaerales bacterium]